jgi:transposase
MPPSAEGLSKPPALNRAQRRAAARRPGKQPGAEGQHLAQVEAPDALVVHAPKVCRDCGADLSDALVVGVERRQVFDLPKIAAFVTEHRMERRRCSCGCESKALAPRAATAPACYGPGVRSLSAYLAVHQHLPYDRMAQLFSDVLGITVSTGALAQMVAEAGKALEPFTDAVRDALIDALVVHFDETGARVAGRLHWVHVAANRLFTLIDCHPRRGAIAMDDLGVIANMTGVAVHDGWRSYRCYDVAHSLCNAHHLRELQGIAVVFDQEWAGEMITLLLEAKEATDAARTAGAGGLDATILHSIRTRYGILIQRGWAANPAPPIGKRFGVHKTAANLLKRLDGQRTDVLRFVVDLNVPFDNNQAERDVRMVKLQQKISGTWRTLAGARNYCAIRSYISTMNKHDHNVLDGLRSLFDGHAWLPGGT